MNYEESRQHLESCLNSYQTGKSLGKDEILFLIDKFKNDISVSDEEYSTFLKSACIVIEEMSKYKIEKIKSDGKRSGRIFLRSVGALLLIWLTIYSSNQFIIKPIRRHFCQLNYVEPRTYKEQNPCHEIM